MRRLLITGLTVLAAWTMSAPSAQADGWYPSPTGWRNPAREAGRPWLRGTPYQPRGRGYHSYRYRSYYYAPGAYYSAPRAVQWYYDQRTGYYWYQDYGANVVWFYHPYTRAYFYRPIG